MWHGAGLHRQRPSRSARYSPGHPDQGVSLRNQRLPRRVARRARPILKGMSLHDSPLSLRARGAPASSAAGASNSLARSILSNVAEPFGCRKHRLAAPHHV